MLAPLAIATVLLQASSTTADDGVRIGLALVILVVIACAALLRGKN